MNRSEQLRRQMTKLEVLIPIEARSVGNDQPEGGSLPLLRYSNFNRHSSFVIRASPSVFRVLRVFSGDLTSSL